ncbi:MAG: transcriptional accessory protein Tex, partial [Planctomycetaceae bacterium]|nr:transcriptional accessory protein Tex [Planctomycetaceae bacterium]
MFEIDGMDISISIDLELIAKGVQLPLHQVQAAVALLDDGNTIPFITRYRKDQTGGLNEEQIREIQRQVEQLRTLEDRKQKILKSIDTQGRLTEELTAQIQAAKSSKWLEDLYLPFKPKKQTLATKAREQGLEPLAVEVLNANCSKEDLDRRTQDFVDPAKALASTDDVWEGVGHLLAENFGDRADVRNRLRRIFRRTGKLVSTRIEPAGQPAKQVHSNASDAKPDSPPAATENATAAQPTPPVAKPDAAETEVGNVDTEQSTVVVGADQPAHSSPATAKPAEQEPAASVENVSQESQPTDSKVSPKTSEETGKDPVVSESKQTRRFSMRERRQEKKDKKRKKLEAAFKDYFKYSEPLQRIPPHRMLAINRGERAGLLRVRIEADNAALFEESEKMLVDPEHPHAEYLSRCTRDSLTRLILPSLEREARRELTDKAEIHAIQVFVRNLRNLLLQPPVVGRRVLAIDPGFRSGCKLAALDEFGGIVGHGLVHIVGKSERLKKARDQIVQMINEHNLSAIAIGNGTACRETENLVAEIIAKELADHEVEYTVVNEAGASVYSTSPLGREEMPELDATQRSAVSIGRRLLDPLSELVKINPANIGVGLYQHDVKA